MEELVKPILAIVVAIAIFIFLVRSIWQGKIYFLSIAGLGGGLIRRDKNPGLFYLMAIAYLFIALFIMLLAGAVIFSVLN
jgi:hypothetical protein